MKIGLFCLHVKVNPSPLPSQPPKSTYYSLTTLNNCTVSFQFARLKGYQSFCHLKLFFYTKNHVLTIANWCDFEWNQLIRSFIRNRHSSLKFSMNRRENQSEMANFGPFHFHTTNHWHLTHGFFHSPLKHCSTLNQKIGGPDSIVIKRDSSISNSAFLIRFLLLHFLLNVTWNKRRWL